MKTKTILGIIVAINLTVGLCGASAQTAPKAKPQMPPLPPGLVMGEDGKLKEDATALAAVRSKRSKQRSGIAAANPAPGSRIDEPAGAATPGKKEGAEASTPK